MKRGDKMKQKKKRILIAIVYGLIMGLLIGVGNRILYASDSWWKMAIFATCLVTAGGLTKVAYDSRK